MLMLNRLAMKMHAVINLDGRCLVYEILLMCSSGGRHCVKEDVNNLEGEHWCMVLYILTVNELQVPESFKFDLYWYLWFLRKYW